MEKTQTNKEKYPSTRIILDVSLHARPSVSLVNLAQDYFTNHGCRIYVRKEGMDEIKYPDDSVIRHNNKKYLDMRSIIYTMGLVAGKGEELEFIALGEEKHAKRALDDIETLSRNFEEELPF